MIKYKCLYDYYLQLVCILLFCCHFLLTAHLPSSLNLCRSLLVLWCLQMVPTFTLCRPCTITFSGGWVSRSGQISTHQRSASKSDHLGHAKTSKMNILQLPLAVSLLSFLPFRLLPLPVASSILTVQEHLCSLLLLRTVLVSNFSLSLHVIISSVYFSILPIVCLFTSLFPRNCQFYCSYHLWRLWPNYKVRAYDCLYAF